MRRPAAGHRRRRLHRLQLRAPMLERHPTMRVTVLDKLTYAGNLANLADLEGDSRFTLRRAATSPTRTWSTRVAADADAIVNFAAESHVDRSIEAPDAVHPDRRRRHARAARGGAAATAISASCRSAPTRCTATSPDGLARPRRDRARAEQPVRGQQGGRATCWCGATPRPTACRSLITRCEQQLSGRTSSRRSSIPLFVTNAIDGEPLPALRRRPAGARLAVRRRPLRRASSRCCARATPGEVYNVGGGNELTNLDLTRRDPRPARQAETLMRLRGGPARPRPPLRGRLLEAPRARLGARALLRRRAARDGGLVSPATRTGGGRSSAASTASTTAASTATGWQAGTAVE